MLIIKCYALRYLCFLVLADPRGAILEKVPVLDALKIVHIAAGAEHSAVVTGKILFNLYCLISIFLVSC